MVCFETVSLHYPIWPQLKSCFSLLNSGIGGIQHHMDDFFFFLTFYLFIMHGMYAHGDPSTTAVLWKSEDTVLSFQHVGQGIEHRSSHLASLVLRK